MFLDQRKCLCYINGVEISWLGHSCFRLKGSQSVIITDPYPTDMGYTMGKQEARIVTVSHQHPSHSFIEGIGGEPHVVARPGEYEIGGVLIMGIATFHDAAAGKTRGKNTVYHMEIDGISVCHLGDLGHKLSDEQAEEIDDVDVLLIPVGGVSTIDAALAAQIVRQIVPKIVIPMHYKTPAINRELAPVSAFLKEMGIDNIEAKPKLSVTPSGLPAGTQVHLLDY